MSAPIAQCPQCFHRVPAPVEPTGKLVCPSCEFAFAPKAEEPPRKNPSAPVARAIPRASSTPAAVPLPVAKPAESARATPIKRADDPPRRKGDDEDGRSRSRRRDDDDDDRPPKRRPRDEDDEDKPAKKKRGSALPIILIVGGLLAVLTIGGVVAVVASVMWSSPVANATTTTSAYSQVSPTKPIEPDWIEPNRPNGPGGLGKGLGGDFQQPGGLDAVPQPGKLNDGPQPGKPGGVNPGRRGGGIPVRPDAPPVEPWNPQPDKPKVAADEIEVKLPGTVADTCSGGGGRYFILHLSGKKQLAVFDVTQSKVVKYIPLTSDSVKFAAGQDKLIVVYPDDGVLARFDLTTFEKETTAKSPVSGTIRHVCMGSASNGPLLVSAGDGQRGFGMSTLTFLDPDTFKSAGIDAPENRAFGLGGDKMHFRASPDGTLFGAWSTSGSPTGLNSITVRGKKATSRYEHSTTGYVVPGADGRIYTGQGLYTAELKKLSKQPGADQWGRAAYLPAVEGNLYLHVSTQGNNGIGGGLGGVHMDKEMMKADVRMDGDDRSLHTFKDLGPFGTDAWAGSDFTSDKRIHFHPSAHLLVMVPQTNDRLLLRKFDLEASLTASGVDYLYVTSRPHAAEAGKGYEYQINVRSKKGGVKYKLDAGPTGLKLSDTGKVTWAVPNSFTIPEQVIITISDASKQEIFHTFELAPAGLKGIGPGAEKPANPKQGDAKDDTLVGTWATDSIEIGGSPIPATDQLSKVRYTFDKDGGLRVIGGPGDQEMSGTYKVDSSADPKTIDMTMKLSTGVVDTQRGVYEVSVDTLLMSFSSPAVGARPKDLGGGQQAPVIRLKRVKDEAKKEEPKKPIDQLPKKEEPSGSIPPVNPPSPPKDLPVAPVPKGPIKSVVAAPFDDAWAEYVKRTGLAPASFSGEVVEIGLTGLPGWPVVGGGGRYLAIPIALKKVVQVVDLGTAKIAFELPYDASKQAIAANLTHVFVRDASAKNVTRYALATGKSDKSADLDLGTEAGLLVAASASADAPLLVCGNAPKRVFTALDPNTLKELPDLLDAPGQVSGANGALHLSADGNRALIQLVNDPDRRYFHLGTRTGDKFTWVASGIDRPPARATRDFLIAGTGTVSHRTNIYNPNATEELKVPESGFPPVWRAVGGGPLYGVLVPPERDRPSQFSLTSGPAQPRLFLAGFDVKPADVITHVSESLGVIAHFGENSNRLVVRKFDLKKLTEASSAKEPLIALAPPPAQRGQVFTCTPAVLAKGKKVALALTDGPDGMTLTDAGVLEWVVPVNFPDPFTAVTLTATAAGGEKSTLTIYPAVTGAKR